MVHNVKDHIERAVGSGYRRVSLAIQRRSLTIHDRDLNKHKERTTVAMLPQSDDFFNRFHLSSGACNKIILTALKPLQKRIAEAIAGTLVPSYMPMLLQGLDSNMNKLNQKFCF